MNNVKNHLISHYLLIRIKMLELQFKKKNFGKTHELLRKLLEQFAE